MSSRFTLHIEPAGPGKWQWEMQGPGGIIAWGARVGTKKEVTEHLNKALERYRTGYALPARFRPTRPTGHMPEGANPKYFDRELVPIPAFLLRR